MMDNNLKFCREELEMTQKELGFVFGVSYKTISGWENNYDTIPLDKLVKFCNLYDFSMDYVVGLERKNIIYSKIPKLNKTIIGKKLREIRKELNLKQKDIANECGISQTTYSNYELGLYLIKTLTLYTICKNHNISMDYVCGRIKK